MLRTVIGATVGMACALLALAGYGAWYGYHNGVSTNGTPPGVAAAASQAVAGVVFYGVVPAACGAIIGGLAGFGSWLVRPRIKSTHQS
jgi:hypothetical protein